MTTTAAPPPAPPKPSAAPPEPVDEVEEAAPAGPTRTNATVYVSGSVKVVLVKDGQRLDAPGDFDPGSYKVEVEFTDGTPPYSGSMDVRAGVDMQITCSAAIRGCRIRER